MESFELVCATLGNNEGQTKIYLKQKQKKMIQLISEISAFEDNRSFLYCLVVFMFMKKGHINKLKK